MKLSKENIFNYIMMIISLSFVFGFFYIFINTYSEVKEYGEKKTELMEHPIKNDSTFVLELTYVNGIKEIETFSLPSDSEFFIDTFGLNDGSYRICYKYNIGVPYGDSKKSLKLGVVNFKIIKDEE